MALLASSEPNRHLKEALLEVLENILSPAYEVRKAAEEREKVLEVTEDYGLQLLEVMIDPAYNVAIRQLASVLLNQYVECHWECGEEVLDGTRIPLALKDKIKQILPLGLKEPVSKIRTSVAHTISTIAWCEYPNPWPNLYDSLLVHLTSGDEWAVHGSIRVIMKMWHSMNFPICNVSPLILREMNEIVKNEQVFSSKLRSRAVNVFVSCASTVLQKQPSPSKEALIHLLPDFYDTMAKILLMSESANVDLSVKTEVIKALTCMLRDDPRKDWLTQLLPAVWHTLTVSAIDYYSMVISCMDEERKSTDSDGYVIGIENLILSIFDFINCLIEYPKLRGPVESGLPDLLYYVIFYSQMTAEQTATWSNDPDIFIIEESSDSYEYNVRLSAQDMIENLCYYFKTSGVEALTQAISKHLQEASAKKISGDPNWWRIHEACMFTLGGINGAVAGTSKTPLCDVQSFIQNVVIPDTTHEGKSTFNAKTFRNVTEDALTVSKSSVTFKKIFAVILITSQPFLLGKCLWFGSRYASLLSPEMNLLFIQATVSALQQGQHPCVRISAVRALAGFCQHFTKTKNVQMILPLLPSITDALLNLAIMFSSPVKRLVFETMACVLSIDQNFAASVEGKVIPFTIAVFLKFYNDPMVTILLQDIFKAFCINPLTTRALQQKLIPTLVAILSTPYDKVSIGLLSVALDVLQTVVRHSLRPLSDCLISDAFPAVINCVLHTEESAVLQSGGECLRAYISASPDQVFNFQDNEGHSGLSLVFQVLAQLLNPFASDSSALYVGRLAITLVNKAGTYLGENLDHLLKAVLSKMQCTQTNCVIQSLVLVYAYLIHTQLDAVLNFLSTVPGPTGESALQFVLTEWCSHQHLFGGRYEGKICITALSKLLLYGISSQDLRLSNIQVSGDAIVSNDGDEYKSHEDAAAQWTIIPLYVKIFKLLLYSLNCSIPCTKVKREMADEKEDDIEGAVGYNSDDESPSQISSDGNLTEEDHIGFGGAKILDDNDPDAIDDPIYHIDLNKYLTDFCYSLRQQHCFESFVRHLTTRECAILCKIGIDVKME